jgi:hypothetical protein
MRGEDRQGEGDAMRCDAMRCDGLDRGCVRMVGREWNVYAIYVYNCIVIYIYTVLPMVVS